MYLLDANVCIRVLNKSSEKVAARLRRETASNIHLCAVTKAALIFGARNSSRVNDNLRLLDEFFRPFISLPFDDHCAEQYGIIRAELTRLGCPIGPNDTLIAATARAHDLTLVTHNTREFSRVTGLRIEDWE